MKIFDHVLLPVGLMLIAGFAGFLADSMARMRRTPHEDRGDFWARAVQRICLVLGLPLLVSEALVIWPDWWKTGRHLEFDLTMVAGLSFAACYRFALILPFAVWLLLLAFGAAERPGDPQAARWLAGAIGFNNSRHWVLLWTLPLAAILVATFSDLGGGPVAYPAAAWGTLAVLLLSLVALAFSAGKAVFTVIEEETTLVRVTAPLQPWPAAMQARGFRLRLAASWQPDDPPRPVRASSRDLAERLRLREAIGVAPELVETVDDLFRPASTKEQRNRLILAPDGCGQAEVVALAAELLDQRFHAATLVVTARGASELATELARWLPDGPQVKALGPAGRLGTDVVVAVVDAQTLSDQLLPQLKDPHLLKRLGLIVWWQLDDYTGVLAANLWAISRRLHRLLEATGRQDVRTLAFVRSAPHGAAQTGAFVRRMLPHAFPPESVRPVDRHIPRPLQVHVLEAHDDYFARGAGRNIQEQYRHLELTAAKVSVEEMWPTSLEVPSDIPASEAQAFLQMHSGDTELRERLESTAAEAGARLRKVEAGDVLSLVEIISQGGRAVAGGLPHHVGVTLPFNPYVAHVLSKLAHGASFPTSRRLVSAAAHPNVIQRHLLLALDELPDTKSGLLKDFLQNEPIINRTIEQIARDGKLTRKEVRFLDDHQELKRESEYKSQHLAGGDSRPLDTVGTSLISVSDVGGGHQPDGGVMMQVDADRLTIQAYPHRVFVSGGDRYRIREWDSVEHVRRVKSLECERDNRHSTTWRVRNSSVFGIEPSEAPVAVGRRRHLARFTASLTYEEEVTGVIRLEPNLTTGDIPKPDISEFARELHHSFATRALLLCFSDPEDPVALGSLAETMRHLLPVHLGVEEDALEVVPLTGEAMVSRRYGLAIVDLYPGGIGLVDAIRDDNTFLLELLQWAEDWLSHCSCNSDAGCPRCLRSPSHRATTMHRQPPSRKAALDLLRQVV